MNQLTRLGIGSKFQFLFNFSDNFLLLLVLLVLVLVLVLLRFLLVKSTTKIQLKIPPTKKKKNDVKSNQPNQNVCKIVWNFPTKKRKKMEINKWDGTRRKLTTSRRRSVPDWAPIGLNPFYHPGGEAPPSFRGLGSASAG